MGNFFQNPYANAAVAIITIIIIIVVLGFIIYKLFRGDREYEDDDYTDYEEDREIFDSIRGKIKNNI